MIINYRRLQNNHFLLKIIILFIVFDYEYEL